MKLLSFCILLLLLNTLSNARVIIYPAPTDEVLNTFYNVCLEGKNIPVYNAKISAADDKRRFAAVDDVLHSAEYYDTAAFSYFDMQGLVTVKVSISEPVKSVKILPASANIQFTYINNVMKFNINRPLNLTIEINGETVKSLHIFINPIEKNRFSPNDPNVIYFGPGVHYINSMSVGNNKTVYIAGGAIVRAIIGKNEKFGIEPSGLKNYGPRVLLKGNNIKLCGRGIIDAGECPTHSGNFVVISGNNITVEGVIVRNSSGWTMPLRGCRNVTIDNVKFLSYRANTDGIDICNSNNIVVKNCFVRTGDDLIVVKTEQGEGSSTNIEINKCILWNPVAHALSLGAELRENVSDVKFEDCDIIHDRGREWSLRVFQSDSSVISCVQFKNIRIEESHRLISLWIDKNASSVNKKLGYINYVSFDNIIAVGSPLSIELHGGDVLHVITDTKFNQVLINNKKLEISDIEKNQFYNGLIIKP